MTCWASMPNSFMTSSPGALRPKRCRPMILPSSPTYCDQSLGHAGFDRDPPAARVGQNFVAIALRLPLETLEAGHRDDAGRLAQLLRGGEGVLQFAAAGKEDQVELAGFFLRDVTAARARLRAGACTSISFSIGTACLVRASNVGPSIRSAAATKAPAVSSGSAGRMTSICGMTRTLLTVSTGSWVGPSSPTPIESWVKM